MFLTVARVFADKERIPAPKSPTAGSYITAGALAVALLFHALELLGDYKDRIPTVKMPADQIFELVCPVLALLAIFALFLEIYYEKRDTSVKAFFGIATSLFFASFAAYVYFKRDFPINAPNKITEEMAFLFAAVYFIYETRISLGRSIWRLHATFGLIAFEVAAYNSIPALILYPIKGECITDSITSALVIFLVAVFALVRVLIFSTSAKDEKCTSAETVDAIFAERLGNIKGEFAIAREDNNVENHTENPDNYEIQLPESEPAPTEEKNEDSDK